MNKDKMRKAFVAYATSGESHIKAGLSWDSVEVRNASEAFRAGWQAATRAAVPAWQPIDTAPKDGTVVLARIPDQDVQQAVMWSAKEQCWVMQWDHWKLTGFDTPTHWMSLLPAPKEPT